MFPINARIIHFYFFFFFFSNFTSFDLSVPSMILY